MTRAAMWSLLAIVASSAAVLSFAALRDLAILCSFHERLSFLLPLVVDAGAAAGCLVWLSPKDVTTEARRFARALTWILLASSVAGNAIVHGLSAYGLQPHWTLVVAVSGVAPAVLGAVVHLSVLVGRTDSINESMLLPEKLRSDTPVPSPVEAVPAPTSQLASNRVGPKQKPSSLAPGSDKTSAESLARALVAENPTIGRRKLMTETGLKEFAARKLLEQVKAEAPRNGAKVLEDVK